MILNKYTEIMNHVVLTDSMRDEALDHIRKKQNAPKHRQWSWEKSLALAASFVIVMTAAILLPRLNNGPAVEGPTTYDVTESTTSSGGSVGKGTQAGGSGTAARSSEGSTAGKSAEGTRQPRGSHQSGSARSGGKAASESPGGEEDQGPMLMGTPANEESVQSAGPQNVNSRSALEQRMGHRLKMPAAVPFSASQFLYTDYGDGMGGVTESGGNSEVETRMAKLSDTGDPSGDYTSYNTTKVKTINGHSVTLKGNDGKYQLAVWNDGTYSYSVRSNRPLTEAELTELVRSMK